MSDNKLTYFHSDDVNDIMGKLPSWVIRRGMGVIFIIFVGIMVGCYFIKYPQTITAPIIITTTNPPADLITKAQGRIDSLFVRDGDKVTNGTIIALLFNTANYSSVFEVEHNLIIDSDKDIKTIVFYSWIEKEYQMGEIQTYYADFRQRCIDFRNYLKTSYLPRKRKLLIAQIIKNKELYKKQLEQENIIATDMTYEQKKFLRDSMLYNNKVISALDYERSFQSLIQKRSTHAGFEVSLKNTELMVMQMEQQLIELSNQFDSDVATYILELSKSRQQLISQISIWKDKYVIKSPIAGKVTFTKFWSKNQNVQIGERLASIVPNDTTLVIGKMYVPSSGFGRVVLGQKVNIKLNGYPYMEFGILRGEIQNLSSVPEKEGYACEVIFPYGMQSSYKEKLKLIQQMDGTGDIVTKDMRLIERFIQPIRALFDKII
ncbi:MAG: HlyD family efflux transporter periplasmic adaptor subunit [Bacteroidales bacterium]